MHGRSRAFAAGICDDLARDVLKEALCDEVGEQALLVSK
jgi:hypothetical protein